MPRLWKLQTRHAFPHSGHDQSGAALQTPLPCALQRTVPGPYWSSGPSLLELPRRENPTIPGAFIPETVGRDHTQPRSCCWLRLYRSAPGEHSSERIFSSGAAVLPLLSAAGGTLFPPPSPRSHSDPGLAGWTVGEFTIRQGWGHSGPGIGLGLACNKANGPVGP